MIKSRHKIIISILSLFFTGLLLHQSVTQAQATAGINETINFQGKVTNLNGTNVSNASYDFVFRLYKASSGGVAQWTETWNSGTSQVAVSDGVFRVALGTHSSISNLDWNDDAWYLSVEFNGDGEMDTRIRLTTAPYALNAKSVAGLTVQDSAGGADTTGTLKVADGKTLTFVDDFTTAGAFGLTLTTTALTNVTLPTTGTLSTLAGSEELTNKTIGSTGLTFSGASTDITTAGGEALVLNGNAASTFQTSAGAITFQAAGTGTASTVQIGAGGAGSTTPDFFGLDVKSDTGDPVSGGFEGAMYYNTADNVFRCYQNTGWTNCIGSGGTPLWSGLQTPTDNLSLSMAAYNTTFTWDPGANTTETAFTLNFDGEDSAADEDQVLMALNQTSNGTDVTEAADALLTFTNSDANDPVENAIRFDAGAAGTDFTYGINFDAASIGTAEFVLQNGETIDNTSDGTIAFTSAITVTSNIDTQGTIQAGSGNITLTDATGNILESIIADGTVLARVAGTETITGGWTFNTAATTFTTAVQANGGLTTSTTNTNLTLAANGSGDIVFSNDADTNVQVTAGAASGVDLLGVSTNGNSVTTTAIDGVQIDFANGGASAIDNAGLRINMTANNNHDNTLLQAIAITSITGQASAEEYALTIGSGWDRGLSVASASTFTSTLTSEGTFVAGSGSNTFTFNPASGPLYAGTARPTKRITIEPEYPGASLTADGASNTGTFTSDNMTSSPYRNFYKWANTQGTAQDYDIWVRVPLPADFAAMAATPTLSIDTYTSDTTNGTVLVTVYDTSNSADCTSASFTPTSTSTWQSKTQTTCLDTGTYVANGIMTIMIKLTGAATSGDTRVSTIYFDYLAKF